jgi:hypothetical protein
MERYLVVDGRERRSALSMQREDDKLTQIVRTALVMADDLNNWGVAAALNKALIELTGEGMPMPRQVEQEQ